MKKRRLVLKLRFGLDDDRPRTLQEIGDRLNLTRERIRQIEQKAMRKLSRSQKLQHLQRISELSATNGLLQVPGDGLAPRGRRRLPGGQALRLLRRPRQAGPLSTRPISPGATWTAAWTISKSTTTPTRTPSRSPGSSSRTTRPRTSGCVFIGPCGVGKTHLAVAIIQELIRTKDARLHLLRLPGPHPRDPEHLHARFRPHRVGRARPRLLRPRSSSSTSSGPRGRRPGSRRRSSTIINHRYNHKKMTLFTTNYPDTEERRTAGTPSTRRATIPSSTGSACDSGRGIYEMCKVVEMGGDDYRKMAKQASYRF